MVQGFGLRVCRLRTGGGGGGGGAGDVAVGPHDLEGPEEQPNNNGAPTVRI